MRLVYIRLRERGMQTKAGRLSDVVEASPRGFELELISNLRAVKIDHEGWEAPVYVPLERIDNFMPDPEALRSRK